MGKNKKKHIEKEIINNSETIQKSTEMASEEQMETIENFLCNFSQDLKTQLDKVDLLSKISSGQGKYNPLLSEEILKTMNFNPREATSKDIENWLARPQYFSENIRHLSEYLENAVGQYGRAVWLLNNIKSFNYILTPTDANNEEYLDTDSYKHSYEICLDTLRKLNIKYQFPKMDLAVMEDGVAFYAIVETKDNITFLQLPTDYCYITAPWTYGWQFAIDLSYFDRLVCLPEIIPELADAYKVFLEKRRGGMSGAELAPFQYYKLPVEKSFCLTFNPGRADKLPPLVGALGASLDVLSYRDLLKQKSLLDLWKVIAMKIPIDKDTKKMLVPYTEAAQIISMIQGSLPDNIKVYASPFDSQEVNTNQINSMNNLTDLSDNNIYSALGMSSTAFGKESKTAGALAVTTNITYEYASTHMYSQFANLVNWLLMIKLKKFKWKVTFFGNKLNSSKEQENALRMVTGANMPVEYLMANTGFEPYEVDSFINWSNKKNLKSKMRPLQSQYTQSGKIQSGGAPKKDIEDLAEGGEKSKEYEGNY